MTPGGSCIKRHHRSPSRNLTLPCSAIGRTSYRRAHSRPEDVLLIVEVTDSSLDYDHAKLRFYARAAMTEVWIVDLLDERIEVYRAPRGDG